MKKKLLFVTYLDEHPDDGLSYVLHLAKVLHEDLTIFLIYKKKIAQKIGDMMQAATFAEANEHETAEEFLKNGGGPIDDSLDQLVGKCQESGIKVDVRSVKSDAISALEDYFKRKNGIDMVLLGPNVTDNVNVSSRGIKKLLQTVSRPIVTIARQSHTVTG